jgi:hypothetical protein
LLQVQTQPAQASFQEGQDYLVLPQSEDPWSHKNKTGALNW